MMIGNEIDAARKEGVQNSMALVGDVKRQNKAHAPRIVAVDLAMGRVDRKDVDRGRDVLAGNATLWTVVHAGVVNSPAGSRTGVWRGPNVQIFAVLDSPNMVPEVQAASVLEVNIPVLVATNSLDTVPGGMPVLTRSLVDLLLVADRSLVQVASVPGVPVSAVINSQDNVLDGTAVLVRSLVDLNFVVDQSQDHLASALVLGILDLAVTQLPEIILVGFGGLNRIKVLLNSLVTSGGQGQCGAVAGLQITAHSLATLIRIRMARSPKMKFCSCLQKWMSTEMAQ